MCHQMHNLLLADIQIQLRTNPAGNECNAKVPYHSMHRPVVQNNLRPRASCCNLLLHTLLASQIADAMIPGVATNCGE